jgi:hypothetical protein
MAVKALADFWLEVVRRLETSEELERFFKIEVPVQGIFSHRQFIGVPVNLSVAEDLIRKVSDEKYSAFQSVATALSRSPAGLNFWNIHHHLSNTDASHLAKIKDGGRLREAFKIASHKSSFAQNFLRYTDASHDELVIRRAIGPASRVFPLFQVFGTVTGRILVSDPYLQQLRRPYRAIVSAEANRQLVYLDYRQFEPGILAYLSQDQSLIDAYNEGDLYTALSDKIYGNPEFRPVSKRIFLAFSYGMTPESIAKLIAGRDATEGALTSLRILIKEFFAEFPGVEQFQEKMVNHLARTGFVSSLMGNKRYRSSQGTLTHKERRWATNQPIQATASLIFKKALIDLANQFGNDSILLPVHDAVLMQFETDDNFTANVQIAEKIMLKAFQQWCPSIKARIATSQFSDSDAFNHSAATGLLTRN